MAFESLLGQPTARTTLERALTAGKVHHAYRFEGPPGTGKTTAALLLAQALVCPESALGCGRCSACERAVHLSTEAPEVPRHPDVVFIGRGIYPQSLIGASEATGISVEQIRRIVQPRLGYPPHEGQALVFILHDADELTVSAANALLKTLEEPAKNTHFILLTSRPGRLLDTIRSRTLAVRFGPLPEHVLGTILEKEGLSSDLASISQGSLSIARLLAEPDERATRDAFVSATDAAVAAPHPAAAVYFADERPDGRDELLQHLSYLALSYASRARTGVAPGAEVWAERYAKVQTAQRQVEQNASPALALESMITEMRAIS